MPNISQKVWPNNSRRDAWAFLVVGLAALMFGASICSEAADADGATEPIWPTKEWQMSSPEAHGMDSKELAIDWLVLGLGQPPEQWTLTFEAEKLNVRVNIPEGPEISIDSETGG